MANKETEQPIFVNRALSIPSAEYKKWIGELTKRYKQSQVKAAIKVNESMLRFYWSLGRDIMLMKAEAKWGTSVLKNLSLDLQHEFPHSRGLSYTNLKYARQWYAFYNSALPGNLQNLPQSHPSGRLQDIFHSQHICHGQYELCHFQ